MGDMEPSSLRVYGGVDGDHRQAERRARFLEAGLDLLGAPDADATLSVRGVCTVSYTHLTLPTNREV